MKKPILISVTLILVLLLALILISKDMLIQGWVERIIRAITGLRFVMEEFNVSFINTDMRIKDLLILNPKDFSDRVMVNAPEIYINYDIPSLFKKKPHLRQICVNIKEFLIVKNENGNFNLDYLKVVKATKQNKKPQDIGDYKVPPIRVDQFELKLDKVVYKDYSKGRQPEVSEFKVNIHEQFQNVEHLYALTRMIATEAIKKAALEQYLTFNLDSFYKPIQKTLLTVKKIQDKVVSTVKDGTIGALKTIKISNQKKEDTENTNLKTNQ